MKNIVIFVLLLGFVPYARSNISVSSELVYLGKDAKSVLGGGFDSVLFEGRHSPFEELEEPPLRKSESPDVGTGAVFEKKEIRHRLDLHNALAAGVRGSYSWGLGSVAGSLFSKQVESSKQYVYRLMLDVSVKGGGVDTARRLTLTPEAKELLRTSPNRFYSVYGDYYVHAVRTGSRFYALFEFESLEESSYKDMHADLSVNSMNMELGAFVSQLKTRASGRYTTTVTIKSTDATIEFKKLEELDQFAREFPRKARQSVVEYILRPYARHPAVVAVLGDKSLVDTSEHHRALEVVYDGVRETETALTDVSVIKSAMQGALLRIMSDRDRKMVFDLEEALRIRADFFKQALRRYKAESALAAEGRAPELPPLPFDYTAVRVPTRELKAVYGESLKVGGHDWKARDIPMQVVLRVDDDRQLKMSVRADYNFGDPSGMHKLTAHWVASEEALASLPNVTYYVMPDGKLSRMVESSKIGPSHPSTVTAVPGNLFTIEGGQLRDIRGGSFNTRPLRIVCLNMKTIVPQIVRDPQSLRVERNGGAVTLSCSYLASGEPSVVWFKNGAKMPGVGNSEVLTLDPRKGDVSGSYWMEVSNDGGRAKSAVAVIDYK